MNVKKMKKLRPAWFPLHEEALTRRWFLLVTLASNRSRWRWSVQKRDTHERFSGTRLAQSFTSARGYASTRERAKSFAEAAVVSLEEEEAHQKTLPKKGVLS